MIMCSSPPSHRPLGRSRSTSFDGMRRLLHAQHKRATADLTQVCDGRSWESFRRVPEGRRPGSGQRSSPKKREPRRGSVDKEVERAADAAAAQEAEARARKSYMPKSTRTQEADKPVTIEDDDDDAPPARPPPRRRSDATSSSFRRRHSDEGAPPSKKDLPRAAPGRRRLSVDSNTASVPTPTGPRVTVRRLSEPMHRCSVTNQNVSGIMRRSRYSSNCLASLAEEGGASSGGSEGRASPRLSAGATADLGLSSAPEAPRRFSRSASMQDLGRLRSEKAPDATGGDWVAGGVIFSQSMEVYLFKP